MEVHQRCAASFCYSFVPLWRRAATTPDRARKPPNAVRAPPPVKSSTASLYTGFGGVLGFNGDFIAKSNLVRLAGITIESFKRGAGGETAARVGRLKVLQLGRLTVAGPTTSFALVQGRGVRPDSAGRMGGGIVSRFKVVLDYSRKQMILEPGANFDDPFEADMSGLAVVAEGPDYRTFVVYKLTADSPAAEAGAREGDVILSVDGRPASEFTLEQIRGMFRREGEGLSLGIKRGGATLRISIKLRRLI